MPKVRLLLRSSLMKDALSALLMQAGFSVCQEPGPAGGDTTVVVDFDDCLDPEGIQARQRHGAKIVVLASEAECLTMRRDQIAPLDGLLTHALSADEWVRALGLICGGERVLPSTLGWGQDPAVPLRGPENDVRGDAHRLSPREREVLLQVVEGRPNKVIARHLHISEGTVKVHLKSLQRKIRVDNRTQAAVWALGHLPALAAQTADAA